MAVNGRMPLRRPLVVLAFVLATVLGAAPAVAGDAIGRSPATGSRPATGVWTGTVSIWRSTAFASQHDSVTCTAAAVQMMLNLVLNRSRHDASEQDAILDYEQRSDTLAESDGSDPAGWAAALRYFGSSRTQTYHWERYASYAPAVRAAAHDLRMTGKPVGLLVYGGTHANVMVGFKATADPALGGSFNVTSVQIAGPWYPRAGLDPPPGTWLSTSSLASRFNRYDERDGLSAWVGHWVIVAP
jgi:hypothetical protein